jgi:hypothetical protein
MKTMIDNAKSKATAPVGITAVVVVLAASGGYWAMTFNHNETVRADRG